MIQEIVVIIHHTHNRLKKLLVAKEDAVSSLNIILWKSKPVKYSTRLQAKSAFTGWLVQHLAVTGAGWCHVMSLLNKVLNIYKKLPLASVCLSWS